VEIQGREPTDEEALDLEGIAVLATKKRPLLSRAPFCVLLEVPPMGPCGMQIAIPALGSLWEIGNSFLHPGLRKGGLYRRLSLATLLEAERRGATEIKFEVSRGSREMMRLARKRDQNDVYGVTYRRSLWELKQRLSSASHRR